MYFSDDSLLPENMPPLMITAAAYGPIRRRLSHPPKGKRRSRTCRTLRPVGSPSCSTRSC